MLGGNSLKMVARFADVDAKTLYRWRTEDEAFRKAYHEACNETFADGLSMLKSKVFRAVEVLSKAMDTATVSTRRVHAANSILRHAIKATEVLEIAEKQREIEAYMRELDRRDGNNGRQD